MQTTVLIVKKNLQDLSDGFSVATKRYVLTISIKKTEVLFQPTSRSLRMELCIHIDGQRLNNVEHFTYLGSYVSSDWTKRQPVASLRPVLLYNNILQKKKLCDVLLLLIVDLSNLSIGFFYFLFKSRTLCFYLNEVLYNFSLEYLIYYQFYSYTFGSLSKKYNLFISSRTRITETATNTTTYMRVE